VTIHLLVKQQWPIKSYERLFISTKFAASGNQAKEPFIPSMNYVFENSNCVAHQIKTVFSQANINAQLTNQKART